MFLCPSPRKGSPLKRISVLLVLLAAIAAALVALPVYASGNTCANIQSGTITDSAGNPLTVGFDQFGYNYQAHSYVGTYDGLDRVLDGKYYGQSGDWVNDKIDLKWSNDWLSNQDCNGDGKLDRGTAGISLGWETNHIVGTYVDGNGVTQSYEDFVKIGYTGPGSDLWGDYSVLQEVYNDTGGGSFRTNLGTPGLGLNDGWTNG